MMELEKARNTGSIEKYIDQGCVQHMVKSAENARRKTIRQVALRARLLTKQNNV